MAEPVLYLDCARNDACVAVLDGTGAIRAERSVPRHPEDPRGRQLMATIEAVLAEAGSDLSGLAAVAAGVGPGPMTGTRLGIAAAQGLCRALDLPAVAVPAFFAHADPAAGSPQTIALALGQSGTAVATVTADPAGWRLADARLEPGRAGGDRAFSLAAVAAAVAAAAPGAATELAPVYLREPDVRPQFDALGRPLAGGGA